jgi:hypothetical protein
MMTPSLSILQVPLQDTLPYSGEIVRENLSYWGLRTAFALRREGDEVDGFSDCTIITFV